MYEEFTPEYIKRQILENTSTDISTIEGSFAHDIASGVAYNMSLLYEELGILYDMIFYKSLFGEYLDEKCAEYGLARTPGTKAEGVITATANYNTSVPQGTLFSCDGIVFISQTKIQLEAKSKVDIPVEAEVIGPAYNLSQVKVVRPVLPLPGISDYASDGFMGGSAAETDEHLRTRLLSYIKAAGSGCINDYIKWAKEVDGVGTVIIIPTWNGAGTVKVIITDSEYNGASATLVQSVAEHIEQYRPIGAVVTVAAAETVNVSITASLTLGENASLSDVQNKAEGIVTAYMKEVAQDGTEVRISRTCAALLDINEVLDCQNLEINGISTNLDIEPGAVPILAELILKNASGGDVVETAV